MRYKMTISYDGTNYYGFQSQESQGYPSIEECVNQALHNIDSNATPITGQGRTDKGVHAYGQVAHFDSELNIDSNGWCRGINSFLPLDIRILEVIRVEDDFHARFSAKSKEYHYIVDTGKYDLFKRNYVGFYYGLDIEMMRLAINKIKGTHDFRGFAGTIMEEKNSIRTITRLDMILDGNQIRFEFEANSFLKYMVRRLVGIIIYIGLHKESLEKIDQVFATKDPSIFGYMADASGLYLIKVNY